jgi:hypothetical protein
MNQLERAQLGYDEELEAKLTEAITTAIINTSMIDDCLVVRTGESAAALTTVLASMLAMSPTAARSPTAIRHIAESFRKKVAAQVRAAEADPVFHDIRARAFRDDDRERGGRA